VTALRAEGVWKQYSRWPGGERSLRNVLTGQVPLLGRRGHAWALKDISFEVPAGGSLGVLGRNGAGKSTLLRLAAGLTRPTRGAVSADGETAAVLNLGDTFDATLSGRENALTAALVEGWTPAEAKALVPAIAEFAELEDHIDAPVRTYSDGMKMRLAFAVVAQLRPKLLLVDEVISVGDLAFQSKCMERIAEMRAAGTALVLASHDLGLIEHQCEHALWLEGGEPRAYGPASEVVAAYREAAHQRVLEQTPDSLPEGRVGTQQLTIENVEVSPTRVALELVNHGEPVLDPIVEVELTRDDDVLLLRTTTKDSGAALGRVTDRARVAVRFDRPPPGRYAIDVGAYSNDWETTFDYQWHAFTLTVEGGANWDVGQGAKSPRGMA